MGVVLSAPQSAAEPANIAGMIVFLDPGQNGADNISIHQQVPDGRGGTTQCETPGNTTADGYPEHTFNWEVALRVRAMLNQLGVRSAMSRGDDTAPGPCVDERATMANATHPNAIVSIHADGGPATGRGFHVIYSQPPLNTAQSGPAVQFARIMRDQLQNSGVPPANYVGTDGLYGRADLAGLNFAQYPAILIDLGNMKNPADAAVMTSPDGRAKYAAAVVQGIADFLATQSSSG
ncbi:MAG TPA: Rv3717 family N-acetylmuramoyl-L-alanine amidase [Mycobacterium sp.]|nr:Rv3717 family N-acetylmuramoyl-L-alanine amidase [Mycobacterium sp.]